MLLAIVQGWSFYSILALGYLSDGISHSAYTKRTDKFGSDYFFDNLCASLGCFYISKIAFQSCPNVAVRKWFVSFQ